MTAGIIVVCVALISIFGFAALRGKDVPADRNVPGATTGPGKSKLVPDGG